MKDICSAKEQEFRDLKIAYRQKDIALTALKSQHAILQIKSTAQNGTDGYAQLQNDFKELQAKLKIKEDESELYEKHCILLTEACMQQGLNLPAEVPVDAPAPAPADPHDPNLIPGWDFTSESRARQELANHGWGNVQQSNVVHNIGWGNNPAHAPSPSPQPTLDGSYTGPSDSEQVERNQWNNHKGPGKGRGSWKGNNPHGKRGQDQRDDRRDNRNDRDRSDRDVRQKTWASDGKSIAVSWAKSSTIHTGPQWPSFPT
jgi:hypothetical protein